METEDKPKRQQKTKEKDAHLYRGGNEIIDRLLAEHWPDETFYMVQGAAGRRPIPADTAEEAVKEYDRRRQESTSEFLRASQEAAA